MALKPEISLSVGLGTAAVVWAIYTHAMPGIADVRANQRSNAVSSQRKVTTATAVGVVAGISLIAHDPTVFILGGSMVVILDMMHRHAHAVDPATNAVPAPPAAATSGATGVS